MNLAEKIKIRRNELNMSQEELAKKMGYSSRSSINKIENGRPVSQKIIYRLAKVLETTPAYLMGWEEETKKDSKDSNKIRWLNELGAKPRMSERFAPTAIRQILSNEVYIGLIRWNAKPVVKVYENGQKIKKRTRNKSYELIK